MLILAHAPSLSRPRRRWRALALGAATLLLAGCSVLPEPQPDPTRYFLLNSPLALEPTENASNGLTVGLRTIELPGYLRNSRSLVVAHGDNEIAFLDYDRWAEPLEAGLSRVFRDALVQNERINRVATFPFGLDQSRDFDLAVRVLHAEGVEQQGERGVRFVVSYDILKADGSGDVLKQGLFHAPPVRWNGEAATLAAALGRAATAAGQAIAAEMPETADSVE